MVYKRPGLAMVLNKFSLYHNEIGHVYSDLSASNAMLSPTRDKITKLGFLGSYMPDVQF